MGDNKNRESGGQCMETQGSTEVQKALLKTLSVFSTHAHSPLPYFPSVTNLQFVSEKCFPHLVIKMQIKHIQSPSSAYKGTA